MPKRPAVDLQGLLALEARYATEAALGLDPLAIPKRFSNPWDQELSAWVAAHLAYGRVAPMLRAIEAVLAPLGAQPANWLRSQDRQGVQRQLHRALAGWKWRFHTAEDMIHWLLAWKDLDAASGGKGLEPHLVPQGSESADLKLSRFVQRLRVELPDSPGLRFNLPDPLEGSACKRWRMFLRWMVRTSWPDLGLWRQYPTDALVIPLDTHVARVSRFIGLSQRKTPDGRMALEITEALRQWDAADPLRFDFALSHLGILGDCPGVRKQPGCKPCPLFRFCRASQ